MFFRSLLHRLKNYILPRRFLKDESVAEIARRYFVMNAFDGALTILGVVAGSHMARGTATPSMIISAGLGVSIAMGMSGGIGAYLTERSERVHDMNHTPDDPDSPNTVKEAHEEALFLALVDGLTPAFFALIAVAPFFLSLYQIISYDSALIASTVLVMGELFALGAFLGKVAGKNILLRGSITLFAGLVTFLLIAILPF